jgi:hypothetical protein
MATALKSIKQFLERTTPLGELAQQRRIKRGKMRPTSVRFEEIDAPPLPLPRDCSDSIRAEYLKRFGDQVMRMDYLLIWGHGLPQRSQILEMIGNHPHLKIRMLQYHTPKSVGQLIRAVYSHDYAPLRHLRSKTKYLRRTPKEVLFIFVANHFPDEDYYGRGIFRHFESQTIKKLKEEIRDRFNPRHNGQRSEDHVIHASDNTMQAQSIFAYLGHGDLDRLTQTHPILHVPYHVKVRETFTIQRVDMDSLVCNFGEGDPYNPRKVRRVPIEQSPQYKAVAGDEDAYAHYVEQYSGRSLKDDYSLSRFKALAETFLYLKTGYEGHYIAVRAIEGGRFCVIDGLHRAAILKQQGIEQLLVAVIR